MAVVLLQVADMVATVTLNRPERRNALSAQLISELRSVLAETDRRDDVAAIVVTGADPAFCAGLDLDELGRPDSPLRNVGTGEVLPDLAKPLIGAVNGAAVTGGLELALACDFLVASERARFADTHARVGIQPGWGLTVWLPEAVGLRRARQMSATGNFVDAATALAWGLVNHVVPHKDLLAFARGLAADVASSDQAAVRTIFASYDEGSLGTRREALAVEARAHAGGRLDAGRVAQRRENVIARGRAQG